LFASERRIRLEQPDPNLMRPRCTGASEGGSTLYLYPRRDVVYDVGTRDEALAARFVRRLR